MLASVWSVIHSNPHILLTQLLCALPAGSVVQVHRTIVAVRCGTRCWEACQLLDLLSCPEYQATEATSVLILTFAQLRCS
jgi:hypothetical protein